MTRCYGGALVRYIHDGREVTVVSASDFMTNSGISTGDAALAMNLAGSHPRLIWYAPQHSEAGAESRSRSSEVADLIPDQVIWVVLQLCLVVALLALWKRRRIGLVAERLPVVGPGFRSTSRAVDACTSCAAGTSTVRQMRCNRRRCNA